MSELSAPVAPKYTEARSFENAPINWVAAIMFLVTTLPVLTVLPWYLFTHEVSGWAWVFCVVLMWANGIGITAGYHRLFAHRAYQAHPVLKWMAAIFGGMAVQNSILIWASMHRVHHKHVDHVDHDPYSAKRGFWFSHMGWMLRDYPSAVVDFSNARDLQADRIVAFQHRHYGAIAVGGNILIPLALGLAYGDVLGFVLIAGFLRIVINHHVTFFINSLAHYWGRQPYTTENTARDNDFIALLTYGEGYHNYHHLFQWDYRNGIRWWHYDPTKWLIAGCAALGLASNLRRVPEFKIQRAMLQAQFERARAKLAACRNPSRLADVQQKLEAEWHHFTETVGEWTRLQGEKFEAAKQQLSEHLHEKWEHSEMHRRLQVLERALAEQRQRVQALRLQLAAA